MDDTTRLFVYGTLAPGQENHDVMQGIEGVWEPAEIQGTLIKEGWGAAHGCPGVIPDENSTAVAGFLFTSDELPLHWAMLDTFEGYDYRRMLVPVKMQSGKVVDACVYAIRKHTS